MSGLETPGRSLLWLEIDGRAVRGTVMDPGRIGWIELLAFAVAPARGRPLAPGERAFDFTKRPDIATAPIYDAFRFARTVTATVDHDARHLTLPGGRITHHVVGVEADAPIERFEIRFRGAGAASDPG